MCRPRSYSFASASSITYDGDSEIENRAGDVGATSNSTISTKQVDDMNSHDT